MRTKEAKSVVCPVCAGAKEVTVEVTTITPAGATESSMKMDCHICNGTGKVSAAKARAHARMQEVWCSCDGDTGDAVYHPDSEGGKHHWTCRLCGKLVQVG